MLAGAVLLTAASPHVAHAVTAMAWDCQQGPDGNWSCAGVQAPPPEPVEPPPVAEEPVAEPAPVAEEPAPEPAPVAEEPAPKPAVEPEPVAEEPAAEPVPAAPVAKEPEPAPPVRAPAAPAVAAPEAETPAVAEPEAAPEPVPTPVAPRPEALLAQPARSIDVRRLPGEDEWALCEAPLQERPAPVSPEERLRSPTTLTADEARAVKGGLSEFMGNVVVTRADQRLEADQLTHSQETNIANATGNVRYEDAEMVITGSSAQMNLDTHQSEFNEAGYQLFSRHARGEAGKVSQEQPEIVDLQNVTYTTCDVGNRDWQLATRELELDKAEGVGTARHVTVRFKGVPIFYTPYLSFPLTDARKSGILAPTVGNSDSSGITFALPYYWNIAPDMDATITPRFLEKRGWQLGGEFRYLNENNAGIVSGEYLPDDDERNGDDRWLFSYQHNHAFTERLEANIDYNKVSDRDYFDDLGSSVSVSSQTYLPRSGDVRYGGSFWTFRGSVNAFQTLDRTLADEDEPYDMLPRMQFDMELPDQWGGLEFGLWSELVNFDHDDNVTGWRLDLMPSVSLPWRKPGYYVEPTLAWSYTKYDLDDTMPGDDDSPDRNAPVFSLDSGMYFDRNTSWFGDGYVQTLEPRAYYLWVDDEDQDDIPVFDTTEYDFSFEQLFRWNRFTGPDRVGDANQLTLALTSRFLQDDTGAERLRLSLGEIFYFEDRNVQLPGVAKDDDDNSAFVGEIVTRLSPAWNAIAAIQYDHENSETDKGTVALHYQPDDDRIVNLAYRYRREQEIEQTDLSARWPFTRNLYGVGRWNYSLEDNRTVEAFAGIEYDTCCYAFRIVGRHWVNDDEGNDNNAIYLQLELKGLTSVGNKVESLLEEGILGYGREDRFDEYYY